MIAQWAMPLLSIYARRTLGGLNAEHLGQEADILTAARYPLILIALMLSFLTIYQYLYLPYFHHHNFYNYNDKFTLIHFIIIIF